MADCSRCGEPCVDGEWLTVGWHEFLLCGSCCDDLLAWAAVTEDDVENV